MDEAFPNRQNIQRFRKLLEKTQDEEQRKVLQKLLVEEEQKEKKLNSAQATHTSQTTKQPRENGDR